MLRNSLARPTKGGIKYSGRTSKAFRQKTRMLRRWSCPRGIFSSSSSKRHPSTVSKKGTYVNGTGLCGLTISILRAACTSILLRGSANSSAVIRLVRALDPIDSHVVHNMKKYHCIDQVIGMKVSVGIGEKRYYTIGHTSTCELCLVSDELKSA